MKQSISQIKKALKEKKIGVAELYSEHANKAKLNHNNSYNLVLEELYKLYLTTIEKKWSYDYLTKDFFLKLKDYLSKNLIIIAAYYEKQIIALALNFISNNCL